ncbi:hypothetical protein [Amycolatopsis sp. YIM 10]|uniref:hypothetical protein n=1 Tax=Amycolatopsis sp. YIM 10 TaxID=2653857 RepID=UPI00128FE720|nr:hypothetical protein [Amycolatopsis sp. YIM 10]QFU87856.1 hypothetical protein YIM_13350 [Amycolatopsis sp. YIM 10]QFU94831.1 hypothetical protein YIM_48530 [Amycolatopsis sp. YIM 10]
MTDELPGQPDGIDEDEIPGELPDPARAAERVVSVVEWWGDGRIPVERISGLFAVPTTEQPLYARDLVALARVPEELACARAAFQDHVASLRRELEEATADREALRGHLAGVIGELANRVHDRCRHDKRPLWCAICQGVEPDPDVPGPVVSEGA